MEEEKKELVNACIELLITTRSQEVSASCADNIVHIVEDILSVVMKMN